MHHGAGLRAILTRKGIDENAQSELIDALNGDYHQSDLGGADLAMLDYVVKLTERPGAMSARDVASLREHGFDDRAIHDICSITAYFAFVNRIADGLGVELEPDRE